MLTTSRSFHLRILPILLVPLISACGLRGQSAPWWHDATFYEIFVRSFSDAREGPLANDGIGDFQGLIERLDYLNDGDPATIDDLGITAVWLMPIHPSPSYHGYDVTDYFDVHPDYGDVPLMKQFVAAAHARGIRVIIDLVVNHASSQHPWFHAALTSPAAPERELFRFASLPHELYGPWDQLAWQPAGEDFYYAVFWHEMPDWNFRHPAVTQHHRDVANFWLQEVGVDGFRLDAVRYLYEDGAALQDTLETKHWLRDFTRYCQSLNSEVFLVGEVYARAEVVAPYQREEALTSFFEFELARAVIEATRLRRPGILSDALDRIYHAYDDEVTWSQFLANHDQPRIRNQLGDDPAALRLAAQLQFVLPGIPFIYYGEEIGLRGDKPDPELRTPMPWTSASPHADFTAATATPWHPLNPDFAAINVASAERDPNSLLHLYRRLIRLNGSSPALRHGRQLAVESTGPRHYVAARQTEAEVVIVLANLNDHSIAAPALNLSGSNARPEWILDELFTTASLKSPIDPDGALHHWQPWDELPPETVRVLRWQRP
ncbi:alpha-amylase family glycosyl hydrolase [Synoicihabitans lomoniglobus]|uniref:Alpha-amylase family glycosyl hydrolase n=1 Tax=Synoicihabitans lomoniglobus TaxID=2909285 RepID=A0AAF0I472_9BACT|nr:alpha-amylase [Opitutaceae bacterium LMO-M01]WED66599.1 alpha-amylase family glycosyl hydrolase [Opitutaceae bacterium LMO-M01]